MARISRYDKEKRIMTVIESIRKGCGYEKLEAKIMATWNIRIAMAKAYVHAAIQTLAKIDNGKTLAQKKAEILVRLVDVYEDARRVNDRKNAISALREIAKIEGLSIDRVEGAIQHNISLYDAIALANNGKDTTYTNRIAELSKSN